MKKLKLINLSKKPVIEKASMAKLRGSGGVCCCGCIGYGCDSTFFANLGYGYTCSLGDTLYGG